MTMFSADTMVASVEAAKRRELMNCILKVVCPEKGGRIVVVMEEIPSSWSIVRLLCARLIEVGCV